MTLVLGICAADAIVLLADELVTRSELDGCIRVEQPMTKLYGFGRLGVGASGFEGYAEECIKLLQGDSRFLNAPHVQDGVTVASEVLSRHFANASPRSERWPAAAVLVAGFSAAGVPETYALHSRLGFKPGKQSWTGSSAAGFGAEAIMRLLDDRRAPLSCAAAKRLGVLLMRHASDIDLTVGPPATLAMITLDQGYENLTTELETLQRDSERALRRLRTAFWTF